MPQTNMYGFALSIQHTLTRGVSASVGWYCMQTGFGFIYDGATKESLLFNVQRQMLFQTCVLTPSYSINSL